MSSIVKDWVSGRPGGERDEKGWLSTERVHAVYEITGAGYKKLDKAISHPGVEALGDEHLSIKDMFVVGHSARAVDDRLVEVRVKYQRRDEADNPDYAEISIGTSLVQSETNIDKDGTILKTSYPGLEDQGGLVPKDDEVSDTVIRRRELGSPGAKSREFVGKLNEAGWRVDPTAAARTWKCSSITGVSNDGGEFYAVVYQFMYNADTWDPVYQYTIDGKPADLTGLTAGEIAAARKIAQIKATKDFNALGLA